MTKKDKQRLETAARRLTRCGGDCKHCDKCHIYTASNNKALFYAFGCDLLPANQFDCISDTMTDLYANAVETVKFELS